MPTILKNIKRLPWEIKTQKTTWSHNEDKRYEKMPWRRLAKEVRINEPFCRICKTKGIVTLATYTDHIRSVRLGGDFWDTNNLQPLCTSCHNAKKT